MKLTNPPWINHQGGAVYSLDIHPNGSKLATCGQENVGVKGLVVIWNMKPIASEDDAQDTSIPRVLATIPHQAGVNCVRWSVDGSYLACASDDRTVTIYEYGGRIKSSGTIGAKGITAVERYRCVHTLHAHSMEVLNIDWSPDGRFLASTSMDNTIIVFNAKKLPERVVVLDATRKGHDGPVKGLSFDPVGKYLATQSADKTLRIWRTDTWHLETVISKPFEDSAQTTVFSRLAWSSDGQYLFAPCAMNNSGPTCQVIQRQDWDTSLDFVGHRKAVSAVRVCPRLIRFLKKDGKYITVTLLAVGARDKALSVWVFPFVARPVVVLNRLFKHSITDLVWHGLNLAVCSQDGTIKYISFSEKEIGEMLSSEEMADSCETLYKIRPAQFVDTGSSFHNVFDTPDKFGASFIDNVDDLIAKRKCEEARQAGVVAPDTPKTTKPSVPKRQTSATENESDRPKEQIEVRGKDGRRRIQPVFLCSTIADETEPGPSNEGPALAQSTETAVFATVAPPEAKQPKRVSVSSVDKTTEESEESSSDDESMETDDDAEAMPSSVGKASSSKEKDTASAPAVSNMMAADFKKPNLRAVEITRVTVSDTETVLDVPEQKAALSEPVVGVAGDQVEIDNNWSFGGVRSSHIVYSQSGKQRWTAFGGPPVVNTHANKFWVVVGFYERSLRVYSTSCGRLKVSLQLDSVPVRVGLNGHFMFALTQTGKFSSWNVSKSRCIVSRLPISDCVCKDANLSSISITSAGMPLLYFSTGTLFTYLVAMQSWQLIDSNSSTLKLCDIISTSELGDGQLGRLLKRRVRLGPVPNIPYTVRSSVKETQLESWLISAEATGIAMDYKRIMLSYIAELVKNASTEKIKDLQQHLIGDGLILGMKKSALLADVNDVIRKNNFVSNHLSSNKLSII